MAIIVGQFRVGGMIAPLMCRFSDEKERGESARSQTSKTTSPLPRSWMASASSSVAESVSGICVD